MEIFMVIIRFSTLFLSLLSILTIVTNRNFAIPTPTLQNLNAGHLFPANPGLKVPRKQANIPSLFKKINKGKMPAACTVVIPTNTINSVWVFQNGLPCQVSTPIFIHSGPRDDFMGRFWHGRDGHGIRCSHPWIKNTIVSNHFVTFDYFYEPKGFDFGQGVNIDCFDLIYQELAQKNPQAPLIVAATCIGAKIALEFAANRPCDHIQAMILESPFIDVHQLMNNIDKTYGAWLPFEIKSVLKWYFSDCKDPIKRPHADLSQINPNLPIFIAHLENDSFYTNQDMFELVNQLRASGNTNIYLLVLRNDRHKHGHLNNIKEFAQATSAFLAAYNLPFTPNLATEGKELLDIAYTNAQAMDPSEWVIVEASQ